MTYVRYTRSVLAEAVANSLSMTDVVHALGLPINGGSQAHLRRRVDQLGIDTSHFRGTAHGRGKGGPRRRTPEEILVLRPLGAKREAPATLRRALEETGRPYRCGGCGVGDVWNGRPLTLQIDHIDGNFWDCRAHNLRFLCANCHTQTPTYAGRNRIRRAGPLVRVDDQGNAVAEPAALVNPTEEQRIEVLDRVSRHDLSATDAARMLGCTRDQVRVLRERLAEFGSLAAPGRRPRLPPEHREAVIALALSRPELGARRLAEALPGSIRVAASTINWVLAEAGLSTWQARQASSSSAAASSRAVDSRKCEE